MKRISFFIPFTLSYQVTHANKAVSVDGCLNEQDAKLTLQTMLSNINNLNPYHLIR